MLTEKLKGGELTPSLIKRLRKLFQRQDWPIHSEDDEFEEEESVFDKYCLILSHLDNEEQDLLLTLTEDFFYCPSFKYKPLIKKALQKISPEKIGTCKEVFLLPLVAPKDIGKVKSSTSWLYHSLTEIITKITLFDAKPRKGYLDPSLLVRHKSRSNALILFCDDFVGTGDTAVAALGHYNDILRIDSDIPVVVTLVAQQAGVSAIEEFGFEVAATEIRNRGISDSTRLDITRALELMRQIESRLKVPRGYNFGYKQSEALVSMMRTPNNTFPVFWCSNMLNGVRWASPFERK